jgi:hypothetical protein
MVRRGTGKSSRAAALVFATPVQPPVTARAAAAHPTKPARLAGSTLPGHLIGEVESDETFVGGLLKFMSEPRRERAPKTPESAIVRRFLSRTDISEPLRLYAQPAAVGTVQ